MKNKPTLPPGLTVEMVAEAKDTSNMSKAALKNQKRKDKKKKAASAPAAPTMVVEEITYSLSGAKLGDAKSSHSDSSTSKAAAKPSTQKPANSSVTTTESEVETTKKIKNLRKKLKQIQDLKAKISSGELNPLPDQLEKVSREKDLINEIEELKSLVS